VHERTVEKSGDKDKHYEQEPSPACFMPEEQNTHDGDAGCRD
jgi:hypothetical protein